MSNTSGVTDLFQNDTTATGRALDGTTPDRDAVVAAGAASGPGTQADAASTTSDASGAVRTAGSPAAVPVRPAGASGSDPAIDATAPATNEPIPGSQEPVERAGDSQSPVSDSDIAHVFDQTNGVVESADEHGTGSREDDTRATGD